MIIQKDINIITLEFGEYCYLQTPVLRQWDKGQILRILDVPDGTEVQYDDESVGTKYVKDSQVEIPDILLQKSGEITAYVRHINENSETTEKTIVIPVKDKPKPPDYIEPENEQTFRQYVEEVMTTTKAIAEDVQKRADDGEFDGADGKDGKDGSDYILTEEDKEEIAGMVEGGGAGGGGTTNYEDLENKPTVNGTEVKGNLTLEELGLYSRTEIDTKLNALSSLNFEIVGSLPTENISTTTIYLVPKSTNNDINFYTEYIYITNRGWEIIGTTEVDLSNYPTFEEMETAIGDSIQNIKVDIPTPTETTKGGIFAKSVEDTTGMAEVVIGGDGKAYVDTLNVDGMIQTIYGSEVTD